MTAPVAIVIPVWNGAELLRKLLATIAHQTHSPQEVIVVDNGCTDDAPQVACAWGARVIAMGRNAGFAAAVNRGIAASTAEWIALINSDVELREDWLANLWTEAVRAGAWFASGKILSAKDPTRLDGTYDLLALSGFPWRAGHDAPDTGFPIQRKVAMVSATAALYRRELFQRVGNFAEIYESYLEDVDFALRCAEGGFEALYVPGAVCLHQGSASFGQWSPRVTYLFARNQAILVRRFFSSDLLRQTRWNRWVGERLWSLLALRHGQFGSWRRGRADADRADITLLPVDPSRLRQILRESEAEIRDWQSRPPRSVYWRLYFLLVRDSASQGASE